MKTVLLCHIEDELSIKGLSRWMASFSELAGFILIREGGNRTRQRVRAEIRRSGRLRFLFDILPYRLYSRVFLAASDRKWRADKIKELTREYPEPGTTSEAVICSSPNADEVVSFLERTGPDLILARCKTLLKERVFSIPARGTFILHPGICPEYRNAHGCFWALANNDFDKVGATLLKIDAGIDTGPIFGYYSYRYDVLSETPNVIHQRVVYDNLDQIRDKLIEINEGRAEPIRIEGRGSKVWGQPWLSKYFQIKKTARKT